MTVAYELDFETYRPRLYVVPDPSARTAPSPRVRRRRIALAAVVVALLVLLALPIRSFGGSTLAQAAPAQGQEYIVKAGDTLASIANRADPAHCRLPDRPDSPARPGPAWSCRGSTSSFPDYRRRCAVSLVRCR